MSSIRSIRPRRRDRRGAALLLVLIMTTALAALALSAIYLMGTATTLSRTGERDAELRNSADAALQLVKSYLVTDAAALPDTSFLEFPLDSGTLRDAQGTRVTGTGVRVWYGPTGTPTTTGTSFADIIAQASDTRGGSVVRRLQLTRESFAKFAYFSDRESSIYGTIYFAPGDVLFGPVWSNDQISIMSGSPRAEFRDSVWTVASSISGASNGTFFMGYKVSQRRIPLPSTSSVARMRALATSGSMAFTAPTSGGASTVRMRIEFVPIDLNADLDVTDRDEGFIRVYVANATAGPRWLRGDSPLGMPTSLNSWVNCGDWHTAVGGQRVFYPVSVHNDSWFRPAIAAFSSDSALAVDVEVAGGVTAILNRPGARCYPGGDPHLAAVERASTTALGGSDTTFTAVGANGQWVARPGATPASLAALGRPDAAYLFPLSRTINPGSRGVIDVAGTVAVSGQLTGRATLHSTANVVYIDDLIYSIPPGGAQCMDILGIVADSNIVVADNAIFTPQDINLSSGTLWKSLDDTPDAWINAVIMSLNTSFTVENFSTGPTSAQPCSGYPKGRGCLNVVGGLIQNARGPVGTSSGSGYLKRYSYDRCAATDPPPYFPTTGRFLDNYYFEIDPVGFVPAAAFLALSPG